MERITTPRTLHLLQRSSKGLNRAKQNQNTSLGFVWSSQVTGHFPIRVRGVYIFAIDL